MTTATLPHYHIMDSSYGDPLDRPIKTWDEAVRQLRKESCGFFDVQRIGKATEGVYFFVEQEQVGEYDPELAPIMLSIYECTGEQPCPCEEG